MSVCVYVGGKCVYMWLGVHVLVFGCVCVRMCVGGKCVYVCECVCM